MQYVSHMMHLIILYSIQSLTPKSRIEDETHRRDDAPVLGFTTSFTASTTVFVFRLGSGTSANAVLFRPTFTLDTRAGVFVGTTEDRLALFRVDSVVPALLPFRGELRSGGSGWVATTFKLSDC